MTINWKQGLFAAALLLSASLLFVGCGKCKTDKAVADKSTGEIIGEEIDVVEVVPAQTPNSESSDAQNQKTEAPTPAQPINNAPAMTPPATTENTAAPTPAQTPEPENNSDAAPSSTTSDVTISTSCSETTSEQDVAENQNSEPVIESESTCCCNYCQSDTACHPACAPAVEACQPACSAAPTCTPEPVCTPVPACDPVCAPICNPCCSPCRHLHFRRCGHYLGCRTRTRCCLRMCSPCDSACEPACASACMSACDPACQNMDANDNGTGAWSTEQNVPADSIQTETHQNKTTSLPEPKINEDAQRAKAATAVGATAKTPQTPSIALPEAK